MTKQTFWNSDKGVIVIAILGAIVLNILVFNFANFYINKKLLELVTKNSVKNEKEMTIGSNTIVIQDLIENENDLKEKDVQNIILYGESSQDWQNNKPSLFLPYIKYPSRSNQQLMDTLLYDAEGHFSKPIQHSEDDSVSEVSASNFLEFKSAVANIQEILGRNVYYMIRRYLNGPIQFATLLMAWFGILIMIQRFIPVLKENILLGPTKKNIYRINENKKRKPLPKILDRLNETGLFYDHNEDEKIKLIPKEKEANDPFVRYLGEIKNEKLDERSLSLFISKQTCETYRSTGSKKAASETLDDEIQKISDENYSRLEMVRFTVWVVPSLGFVGTVLGIGRALEKAYLVVTASGSQRESAIQDITTSLGTAFDTTLVALLCAIPMMLLLHALIRYQDRLMKTINDLIQDHLVSRFEGRELESIFREIIEDPVQNMASALQEIWSKSQVEQLRQMLKNMDVKHKEKHG